MSIEIKQTKQVQFEELLILLEMKEAEKNGTHQEPWCFFRCYSHLDPGISSGQFQIPKFKQTSDEGQAVEIVLCIHVC